MSLGDDNRRMIDTMIMILALRVSSDSKNADLKERRAICLDVIGRLKTVHISSISWFEYQRGRRPEEEAALSKWQNKLFIHPVTAPVAEHAAELMRKYRAGGGVCTKCLNSRKSTICKVCGGKRSATARINDALILSTAQLSTDVDTLYTLDDALLELSGHLPNSKASLPPGRHGPLFEAIENLRPKGVDTARGNELGSPGPGLGNVFPIASKSVLGGKDPEDT